MKYQARDQGRHSLRGLLGGWLIATLGISALCLQFSRVALADVPQFAPPAASDDETVGSLPSFGGGLDVLDISRYRLDGRPSLFLEGNINDIHYAFLGMQGVGGVSMQILNPATQTVRCIFQGNIGLYLDSVALRNSRLSVGIAVPRSYGVSQTSMSFGGRTTAPAALQPGYQLIPLSALEASGALAAHPLQISIFGTPSGSSSIQAATDFDVVMLTQTHR